jgi:hypothetical protein
MRVWITLDMVDGSQSRLRGPLHTDEIDTFGMLMYLNRADVAGVTFTRADALQAIQRTEKKQ